ncbi:MAG: DUF1073 domain-containing protein [Nitrososphaerota archaeon]|nr:DUF1073 domain-containing protein [Nitrososphaerota archaeon]
MAKNKRVSIKATQTALVKKEAEAVAEAAPAKTTDSFQNFEQNLGLGANNAMSSSSYGFNPITRNRTLLEWIYRGSWLGGVAVDVKADDMTRGGVDIIGEMEPDNVQAIEEESVNLNIFGKINEASKWGSLYGGAVAVILIDGQDVSTALREDTVKKDQFKGLLVMDRWMVQPSLENLVTDLGPHLGEPKYYRVTAMAPALVNQNIHYSRIIRFEGVKLPYWQRVMENLWGLSVLERMYDRMIAFDSATTGAAQLVYKSYLRNYKIKGLRQVVATGGDALAGLTQYVEMMRRFQGIEGMTLIDGDDEFASESHGAFGGLSDILMRFMEQCAGAIQIPLVRLFGQSPSGFSTGDTDLRNYYDEVKQLQERDLKVGVTKIYKIMALSLGLEIPKGFGINFRSLWQLSDPEKSDIASKNVDTVSRANEAGIIGNKTSLQELKQQSKITGIFTNITEEDIEAAENEPPPLPEDVEIAEIREQGQVGAAEVKTGEQPPKLPDTKQLPNPATKDSSMPKAAGIILMNQDGKILILKRAFDAPFGGTWGLPGGMIEAGETPEIAARRELFEETGLAIDAPVMMIDNEGEFTTFSALLLGNNIVKINKESQAHAWIDISKAIPSTFELHPNLLRVLNKLGY